MQGIPQAEAAVILEISGAALRGRLYRLRQLLRAELSLSGSDLRSDARGWPGVFPATHGVG